MPNKDKMYTFIVIVFKIVILLREKILAVLMWSSELQNTQYFIL